MPETAPWDTPAPTAPKAETAPWDTPAATQPITTPTSSTPVPQTATERLLGTSGGWQLNAAEKPQNAGQRLTRWLGNVMNDFEYGTDLTGVGTVLKKMGAHGVDMGNSEDVGNFMASIPLGLLRFSKGLTETQDAAHPLVMWQGIKDIFGGALQTATIPGSFVAPEAGEAGAAGLKATGEMTADAARAVAGKAAAGVRKTAGLPSAVKDLYTGAGIQEDLQQAMRDIIQGAAKDANVTVPQATSIRDIPSHLAEALRTPPPSTAGEAQTAAAAQDELQKGLRSVLQETAKNADVTPKDATSIRDVASNVSDALHEKSAGIYKQVDDAMGGTRFQSIERNIRKLTEQLRGQTGTTPDAEGELIEQLNKENERMQQAIGELKDAGLDPDLIKQATETFRQHKTVEQLSNFIRRSTEGLRPELRQAGVEATPEVVKAGQLARHVNGMYDTGALQDIGETQAQNLLRHVDRAQLATPKPTAELRTQSDALDRLTQMLRKSAKGMRPEEVIPGRTGTKETFEIESLFDDINNLHDSGELREALGPARARDMLNEIDAAHLRQLKLNRIKTGIKVGAGLSGLYGLSEARRAGEHLIEGTYYNR